MICQNETSVNAIRLNRRFQGLKGRLNCRFQGLKGRLSKINQIK